MNQIDIQFIHRPFIMKKIYVIIHFIYVNKRTQIKMHHLPMSNLYTCIIFLYTHDMISLPGKTPLSNLQLDIQSIMHFKMICQ